MPGPSPAHLAALLVLVEQHTSVAQPLLHLYNLQLQPRTHLRLLSGSRGGEGGPSEHGHAACGAHGWPVEAAAETMHCNSGLRTGTTTGQTKQQSGTTEEILGSCTPRTSNRRTRDWRAPGLAPASAGSSTRDCSASSPSLSCGGRGCRAASEGAERNCRRPAAWQASYVEALRGV